MIYLALKAAHIAAVVTWIGGLLVLALLLRAVATLPLQAQARHLLSAVGRWDQRVTSPAMGLAWVLGIAMALQAGWFRSPWLLLKLVLVVALSALHGLLAGRLQRLLGEQAVLLPARWRAAAALTLAAVAGIAVLVVFKPF